MKFLCTLTHCWMSGSWGLRTVRHPREHMKGRMLTPMANTETERAELEEIRKTYIPELFLDYHNALYYAGHVLTSELLVQCMNLAMQVSENEYLTSAFVASRRMAELVDALALASKAMVNTQARPGKKLLGGESLGIWNVEVPDEDIDPQEAQ